MKILNLIKLFLTNTIGILYRDYLVLKSKEDYIQWCVYDNKEYYLTKNKYSLEIGNYVFIGKDLIPLKVKNMLNIL